MNHSYSSKLAALWLFLVLSFSAGAVQNTWTGAGGNMLWTNAANWSLGVLPDSTQDIFIGDTATNAVILDAPAQAANLSLGSTQGMGALTISMDGSLACQGSGAIGSNGVLNLTGGTLSAVGTWTGPGTLRWLSGTMEHFNFGTNFQVEMSGPEDKIAHGYCTNRGTLDWQSEARLLLSHSSLGNPSLNNLGRFILETNCTMVNDSWVYQTTGFINEGTLLVPADRGIVTLNGLDVGWLANRGKLLAGTNSTLTFIHRGEAAAFQTGTDIEGAGVIRIAGEGGGLICDGDIVLNGTLEAAGRRIFGTSMWNGTGCFRWITGMVGTVTFGTNLNVELSGPDEKTIDGPCINLGRCTLQTNCTLSPFNGTACFVNRGTFRVPANLGEVTLTTTGCPIQNEGVLVVETNTVLMFHPNYGVSPQFLSGTIFDGAGLVRLTPFNFSFSGSITVNGILEVAGGFISSSANSTWGGPGLLRWLEGEVGGATFGPDFHVEISSSAPKYFASNTNLGTVRWLADVFFEGTGSDPKFSNHGLFILETNCTISDGYFYNAGTLRVPANLGDVKLSRSSGSLINTGTLFVETNSTLVIYHPYYEQTLFQAGTVFDGPGVVRLFEGGLEITQAVTVNGTVELAGDSAIWGGTTWNGPGLFRWKRGYMADQTFGPNLRVEMSGPDEKIFNHTCTNLGTVRWLQSSPLRSYSAPDVSSFLNGGLFLVEADGAWTNDITFTNLASGTFKQTTGQFSMRTLYNSGNSELIGGVLNVVSNFVAAPGSTCKVPLRGYSPGTDFGQLQAGDLTLNGSLVAIFINGFAPTNGSAFLIVTNSLRHGQFASTALLPLAPNLLWRTSYQPTTVTLQVISAPSLGGAAMLPDGSFQFTLSGAAGGTYEIQASTNLVDWNVLTNASFTGSATFTDTTATNFTRRFYSGVIGD